MWYEIKNCILLTQPNTNPQSHTGVSLMDADEGKDATEWRTSKTHWLPSKNDLTLKTIDERVSGLTGLPISHQEQVQVLKYGVGGRYVGHHDYFNPSVYLNDKYMTRMVDEGRRNRLLTVFWYLNTVEHGGETIFLRSNNLIGNNHKNCDDDAGIKVKPMKGR